MKITLNWLKQYVDFNWPPEELAERLTMLGLEVEGVQKLGGEFEGIVVAQILTKNKVPGSDKLSVCKVNDGRGERTIICGAQNHNPGDKVPLILPNFALPLKPGDKEPFVIKERKVFGITSQGMMCSPQELGLPDEVDGLLILPPDAPIGKPFAEYLGRAGSDVVYDLEVTPNRPDLNSVIGIAREISAATGDPLKLPVIQFLSTSSEPIAGVVSVRLDDAEMCPRYVARVVRRVKIGPSPDWLRSTLEKVGVRSINNVVDITNYVMLETGQPLHAFDYRLLAAADTKAVPTIVVRRAGEGEKFTTLDGQERTLTRDMLLIADEAKGIALAGIMGGQNTEINDRTHDVLIESAYFSPTNIRRTSKALGLRSESSYRFERGADVGICDWASRRAAQLICDMAGGELLAQSVDAYPRVREAGVVSLRHSKVTELLGVPVAPAEQILCLERLGLKRVERAPTDRVPFVEASIDTVTLLKKDLVPAETSGSATFQIPTWRVDLKREADLIEEVARLHGVDKISSTPPRGAIGTNAFDGVYDQIAEGRRLLMALGLTEATGQTLVSDVAAKVAAPADSLVLLANPLSNDMNALRPSLLPGLLDSLRHNVSRKNEDAALFEIGRVFVRAGSALKEERRMAIALSGQRVLRFWSGADREVKCDLYDLKGVLEEFLEQFGLRGFGFSRRTESTSLFLESAVIVLGGKLTLGEFGQLLPALVKRYDLREAVFVAELSLDQLLARRNTARSFKPLPQFPGIRRDVAMLVAESTAHDAVLEVVRKTKPSNLESAELFDVFRGKNVPTGQKSMAYAFTYRASDKTLTDSEVNAAHEKLVAAFKQSLQAVIREG